MTCMMNSLLFQLDADDMSLGLPDVFHLMNHGLAPAGKAGFPHILLRFSASLCGAGVKVRQINNHATPVLMPGFGFSRGNASFQNTHEMVLKYELVRVGCDLEGIQILWDRRRRAPVDDQQRENTD